MRHPLVRPDKPYIPPTTKPSPPTIPPLYISVYCPTCQEVLNVRSDLHLPTILQSQGWHLHSSDSTDNAIAATCSETCEALYAAARSEKREAPCAPDSLIACQNKRNL
jgi:hypothetical protein